MYSLKKKSEQKALNTMHDGTSIYSHFCYTFLLTSAYLNSEQGRAFLAHEIISLSFRMWKVSCLILQCMGI